MPSHNVVAAQISSALHALRECPPTTARSPAPVCPKAYQWPPLARVGGVDYGTGFFGPPCASWGRGDGIPRLRACYHGDARRAVNEALLDCGHDGAATKPSNLAGRADRLSIISEPNQQIEAAKSAFGSCVTSNAGPHGAA
jgi:hypothetical protein